LPSSNYPPVNVILIILIDKSTMNTIIAIILFTFN
jgi:hypothetical protein